MLRLNCKRLEKTRNLATINRSHFSLPRVCLNQIFDVEKKPRPWNPIGVTRDHPKWHSSIERIQLPSYWHYIVGLHVTMALRRTVIEIELAQFDENWQNFAHLFHLTGLHGVIPFKFLNKTYCKKTSLWTIIWWKRYIVSPVSIQYHNVTDRRMDRWNFKINIAP